MTPHTSTSTPPFTASSSATPFPPSPRTSSATPFSSGGSFTPFPLPRTFEERFCSHHQCDGAAFRRFIFWQSVPARLRPIVRLVRWCRPSYFKLDEGLIDEAAQARCVDDVQLDAHDFRGDPVNRKLLRRMLRVRVSTGMLIALSRNYLPQRYGGLQPR